MEILFFIFITFVGFIFGSFMAAWISRAHHDLSIWWGRSHCVSCQYALEPRDLIPILSFLILKGKCKNCQTSISKHYISTETITGLVFLFLAVFYGANFSNISSQFLFSLLVSFFLIGIFISDIFYQEIPFTMTLFLALLSFFMNVGFSFAHWQDMLGGAIIAGGFFFLQYLFSKGKWIGGGDISLGVGMGILLGLKSTFLALGLAYMGGALLGIFLLIFKKVQRKTFFPLGALLSITTFIALVWGEKIIDWYLHLL